MHNDECVLISAELALAHTHLSFCLFIYRERDRERGKEFMIKMRLYVNTSPPCFVSQRAGFTITAPVCGDHSALCVSFVLEVGD